MSVETKTETKQVEKKLPDECENLFTATEITDPVTSPTSGITYEEKDAKTWISKHGQEPTTRDRITVEQLIPNTALKNAMQEYKQTSPENILEFDLKIAEQQIPLLEQHLKRLRHYLRTSPPDAKELGTSTWPFGMICPQSHNFIVDPVITKTRPSITYERKAIETWLLTHNTSPLTGQFLRPDMLVPNRALQSTIMHFFDNAIPKSIDNKKLNEALIKIKDLLIEIYHAESILEQQLQQRRKHITLIGSLSVILVTLAVVAKWREDDLQRLYNYLSYFFSEAYEQYKKDAAQCLAGAPLDFDVCISAITTLYKNERRIEVNRFLAEAKLDQEHLLPFMQHIVEKKNIEFLKILLEIDDKHFIAKSCPDLISYTVEHGDYATLELLLQAGFQVNTIDAHSQRNALYYAVMRHNYRMAELLLKAKVPIDNIDYRRRTALHYAIQNNDYQMVKLLLDSSAKINLNPEDTTTLQLAMQVNDLRIFDLLAMRGACFLKLDQPPQVTPKRYKYSSLETFYEETNLSFTEALAARDINSIKQLIKDKVEISPEDLKLHGLYLFCFDRFLDVVVPLLESRVNIESINEVLLRTAVFSDKPSIKMVRFLLQHGAKSGLKEIAEHLNTLIASNIAHLPRHQEIKAILENALLGNPVDDGTLLFRAVDSGNTTLVMQVLTKDVAYDIAQEALYLSLALKDHGEMFNLILDRCRSLQQINTADNSKLLIAAVRNGNTLMVARLFDMGIENNTHDIAEIILLEAIYKNDVDMFEFLLHRVQQKSIYGASLLEDAVKFKNAKIVALILQNKKLQLDLKDVEAAAPHATSNEIQDLLKEYIAAQRKAHRPKVSSSEPLPPPPVTSGAGSRYDTSWVSWLPHMLTTAVGSIYTSASSWLTSGQKIPISGTQEYTSEQPRRTPEQKGNASGTPKSHLDFAAQLLFLGVLFYKIRKLFSSSRDRPITEEEEKLLQNILTSLSELKQQVKLLSTTPACQERFLGDKYFYVQKELNLEDKSSLVSEIRLLLHKLKKNKVASSATIDEWQDRFSRINKYISQIDDLNLQFDRITKEEQEFMQNHSVDEWVSVIHFDSINNKLRTNFELRSKYLPYAGDQQFFDFKIPYSPFWQELPYSYNKQILCGKIEEKTSSGEVTTRELSFNEFESKRDGSCGFHVLGLSRREVVALLLEEQKNAEARIFLSSEIRDALMTIIPEQDQPKDFIALKNKYQIAENNLDGVLRKHKEDLKIFRPYPTHISDPYARASWLLAQPEISQNLKMQDEIRQAQDNYQVANCAVNDYCCTTESYVSYINRYLDPHFWLGYQTALLVARLQNFSLFIWSKDQEHAGKLKLLASHRGADDATIHMLHTHHYTHFNLLAETSAPTIEEVPSPSRRPV